MIKRSLHIIIILSLSGSLAYAQRNKDYCALPEVKCQGSTEKHGKEGVWLYSEKQEFCSMFNEGEEFGLIMEGNYKKGERTGIWKVYGTDINCKKFVRAIGEFRKNMMQGPWKFYEYKNGDTFVSAEGMFEDGLRNGVWKFYNQEGYTVGKGSYIDGKKEGEWFEHVKRGDLREQGIYENGKRTGKWQVFQGDLIKGEGNYLNGVREGKWKEFVFYSERDHYTEIGEYKKGKKHGLWEQYLGTVLVSSQEYVEDKANGIYTRYYSGGSVEYQCNYKNGLRSGNYSEFYMNGNIRSKGNYQPQKEPDFDTTFVRIKVPIEFVFEISGRSLPILSSDIIWTTGDVALDRYGFDTLSMSLQTTGNTSQMKVEDISVSVRQGEWKEYHSNGQLKENGSYAAAYKILSDVDSRTGKVVGQVKYVDHIKIGTWKSYDEKGTLLEEVLYKEGKPVLSK